MESRLPMKQVSVIGLGRMGGGLAAQLSRHDFPVRVFDISETALKAAVSHGATAATSATDAAKGADVVLTCLPTPEDVLGAYNAAPGGILAEAGNTVFIDVSTIDPRSASEIQRRVKEAGGRFIACPLGKGPQQAAIGESPLFIGGDPEAITAAQEVLDTIGSAQHFFGTVEEATAFKLVSNMIAFANLAALCEGYLAAKTAGIADTTFAAALEDTGGMSYQASLRLPWIAEGDFAPRFAVDLAKKDLRLGVDMAARQASPVPLAALTLQALALASARGLGNLDAAAIVEILRAENLRQI